MKLAKIFIPAFLLATIHSFSQENYETFTREISKITFFNPGISYEKRIGKFQSLYMQALMSTSFTFNYVDALGTPATLYFDPAIFLQYRHYYSSKKRWEKGKRIAMNSLNFFGAGVETIFSKRPVSKLELTENSRRAINKIVIIWGIQRNYKNRFSLDFYAGPAYRFTKITYQKSGRQISTRNDGQIVPVVNISFGIWLNKRK